MCVFHFWANYLNHLILFCILSNKSSFFFNFQLVELNGTACLLRVAHSAPLSRDVVEKKTHTFLKCINNSKTPQFLQNVSQHVLRKIALRYIFSACYATIFQTCCNMQKSRATVRLPGEHYAQKIYVVELLLILTNQQLHSSSINAQKIIWTKGECSSKKT